jgi:hypothetical protein
MMAGYRPARSIRKSLAEGEKLPVEQFFWFPYKDKLINWSLEAWFVYEDRRHLMGNPFDGPWGVSVKQSVIQHNPLLPWPPRMEPPPESDLFDYVEFFYDHCDAEPRGGYFLRQAYTAGVNNIFGRFKLPWKLVKGDIVPISSAALDTRVLEYNLNSGDDELDKLFEDAAQAFYDRHTDHKLEGLRGLVRVVERLHKPFRTNEKGRKAIAGILAPYKELEAPFVTLLKTQGLIVNNCSNIRHNDKDKPELTDSQTIEYLFYWHFNIIRLMVEKGVHKKQ